MPITLTIIPKVTISAYQSSTSLLESALLFCLDSQPRYSDFKKMTNAFGCETYLANLVWKYKIKNITFADSKQKLPSTIFCDVHRVAMSVVESEVALMTSWTLWDFKASEQASQSKME